MAKMKLETLLRKQDTLRKDWLKRIAFQIYLTAWHEAHHATWSGCERCVSIKRNAITAIRLVRSLRGVN